MTSTRVFCLGASAGGLQPLREVVRTLPEDLPAAVFVVLHLSPDSNSQLPEILGRAASLPSEPASDGAPIVAGRIYVAIPDHHLLVDADRMRVVRGPRENRHRPSIDNLFRSAAASHGPRAVGVVLSGALDDGTAGLIAIKIRGGVAIVQDPADAFSDQMPKNAMKYLEPDHVAPASKIGGILRSIARQPLPDVEPPVPPEMDEENRVARMDLTGADTNDRPGTNSPFGCPDCGGVLWEIQEGKLVRFRCRVGHAYSPESLIAAGDDKIEDALWEALRAIEERVALRRRLASQSRERGLDSLADHFEQQIPDAVRHAHALRDMLARGGSKN